MEKCFLCGAPSQGLCKAPHDSGVRWKQFMIHDSVLVFHSTPPARPGSTKELELELVLDQMAQKPMLRGSVGALV